MSTSGTYTGDASASTHSQSTVTIDVPNGVDDHGGNYSFSGSKKQHSDFVNTGKMEVPSYRSMTWSYEHTADRLGTVTDSGNYTSPETPGSMTTSVSSGWDTTETMTAKYWNSWSSAWSQPQTSTTPPPTSWSSDPGPTSGPDGGAEPEVDGESSGWSTALDAVQFGLDIAGFVPGLGEIADGASGLISLARGDYAGAALSFASMIPFAGWGAGAAKIGRQVLKHGDEAVGLVAKGVSKIDDVGGALGKMGGKADEVFEASTNQLKVLQESCFVAGTPILTPEGSKAVETLLNQVVLARREDDPNAPVKPHTVTAVFELTADIWEVHVRGKVIETTAQHPFYVTSGVPPEVRKQLLPRLQEDAGVADKGWTPVNQLQVGDLFLGHDGSLSAVERVTQTGRTETVYHLRVEEDHTFFVGEPWWDFSVWVHNTACKGGIEPNKIGQAFENKAGLSGDAKNKAHIDSLTGKKKYRIPDGMDDATITEAKGGKYVYFGSQLQDSLHNAMEMGKKLILKVNAGAKLSGPLKALVEKGYIILKEL